MLDHIDRAILNTLSDGHFHSDEMIGKALNISHAAIWKHIKYLESLGCEVISISQQGYKLKYPIELLDVDKIKALLNPRTQQLIQMVLIFDRIDSTNDHAHRLLFELNNTKQVFAILAEQQTQGRGRRGRHWESPFGNNIYLSLHWPFDCVPTDLDGLSLVAGLAVRQALENTGTVNIQVKWPNDILHQQRKLAGILVDLFGESNANTHVIIGIGINVTIPCNHNVGQAITSLQTLNNQRVERNQLAAALINNLAYYLMRFKQTGLSAFEQEWLRHDAFYQQSIHILGPHGKIIGTHAGIDTDGHLLLDTDQGRKIFSVGDVSLRRV